MRVMDSNTILIRYKTANERLFLTSGRSRDWIYCADEIDVTAGFQGLR